MKIFDLCCLDSRKSFYGNAKVIETPAGHYLQSYDIIVAKIDNDGNFFRFWPGESATTTRHINGFLAFFNNAAPGGVAWYRKQPVVKCDLNL